MSVIFIILKYTGVLLIGGVIGFVLSIAVDAKHNIIGTLRVDNSIPEDGPRLFLELEKDIPTIKARDYVTLRVNTQNYISQK